jgi:hypothetical protein
VVDQHIDQPRAGQPHQDGFIQQLSTEGVRATLNFASYVVNEHSSPKYSIPSTSYHLPAHVQMRTQAATTLLAAGVAVSLGLGAPNAAVAKPIRLADKVAENEAAFEYQLSKLEYAIQQQETAARAEIAGK